MGHIASYNQSTVHVESEASTETVAVAMMMMMTVIEHYEVTVMHRKGLSKESWYMD